MAASGGAGPTPQEVVALSLGSAFVSVGSVLRQRVPMGRQDGWASGLRPTLLVITAEGERLFPSRCGRSLGRDRRDHSPGAGWGKAISPVWIARRVRRGP